MKINNVLQRLLVFFLGVPIVAALIILLPHYNHLALNIVVILVSSAGAVEFARMLKAKGLPVYITEAAILGSLAPLSATVIVSMETNIQFDKAFYILGASWVLVSEIFLYKSKTNYSNVISRIAAAFSIIIYPGLFLSWIIRLASLPHSTIIILCFALAVIANDSLAWFSGKLFGKNNKGIFSVSPNKSVAGYIGGMTASIAVCTALAYVYPEAFKPTLMAKLPSAILLGFFCGLTVILGDLAESAIKRSCGFDDSGSLIPGRGGVLDSTDSIALSAPLFYFLYVLFF